MKNLKKESECFFLMNILIGIDRPVSHLCDPYLEGTWPDRTKFPQHDDTVFPIGRWRLLHTQKGFVPISHRVLTLHEFPENIYPNEINVNKNTLCFKQLTKNEVFTD